MSRRGGRSVRMMVEETRGGPEARRSKTEVVVALGSPSLPSPFAFPRWPQGHTRQRHTDIGLSSQRS